MKLMHFIRSFLNIKVNKQNSHNDNPHHLPNTLYILFRHDVVEFIPSLCVVGVA